MWKKNTVPRKWVCWLLLLALPSYAQPGTAPADLKAAERAVRTEDYDRAFTLYSRAASNGNSEAQYRLANLYRLGKGVAPSAVLEKQWLQRAATSGHAGAAYSLALLIQAEEPQRASDLIEQSAAAGFVPAQKYQQPVMTTAVTSGVEQTVQERWFAAARKGRVADLRVLAPQLGDIDSVDTQQRSALMVAVQAGETDAVAWLLAQGASPSRRDRFGKSAAFIALDVGAFSVLDQLVGAGLDINATLPNSDTLLHYAVRRDRVDALPRLLATSLAVNASNDDGWTALDLALFADNQPAVVLLRKGGGKRGNGWQSEDTGAGDALASQWTDANPPDLLQLARIVSAGNARLLRQLLPDSTISIQQPLGDGRTLLAIAIANGQVETVETLLQMGASPDDRIDAEHTALQWAAQNGQAEVVTALLRRGANVAATNSQGLDAIELALVGGHTELALAMLDAVKAGTRLPYSRYLYTAAKTDAGAFLIEPVLRSGALYRDERGRSALWYAASHGNRDIIDRLISSGLGDDEPDSDGKTPLLAAAESGCLACVARLAPGADLARQTVSGESALMLAAARSDRELVAWLLDHGADVHQRNAQGDSALLVAVRSNAIDVARTLVQAGASPSRKNRIGLSALDIAGRKSPALVDALAVQ